jgi:hypothetical protein
VAHSALDTRLQAGAAVRLLPSCSHADATGGGDRRSIETAGAVLERSTQVLSRAKSHVARVDDMLHRIRRRLATSAGTPV